MDDEIPQPSINETNNDKKEINYVVLRDSYPNYDLSFKVIVIGNSGNLNNL